MKSLFFLITILGAILGSISFTDQRDFSGGELDTLSNFDDAGCPHKCWNNPNGDKYCQQQSMNSCKIVPDKDSVPGTHIRNRFLFCFIDIKIIVNILIYCIIFTYTPPFSLR
ncbi:hypothetical protein ARAF_0412 [Arsenophonus endosymbiont of Aleurodicus floccissimus]|uniref:hypothetical protein n=1 Tax=Arsenophonus endosymbiont of Aleurodicus floccissimus TaxID=2152761 RepID=UPI000E6AFCAF|nr:hypothetical protein [Arsenophonus endosymbiont of Aleurodicus floccissimus]SPP31293.1 hypothetical protein ARAF_0412 [Arsenophonus endosymbiont of Aleurodicus floccissimus]